MPPYTGSSGGPHAHPWPPTAAAAVGVLAAPPAPTGYQYTAMWEIEDPNAKLPNLIRHATPELEEMAVDDKVELYGETTWTLDRTPGGLTLVAVSAARAMPGRDRREMPCDDREAWARSL